MTQYLSWECVNNVIFYRNYVTAVRGNNLNFDV